MADEKLSGLIEAEFKDWKDSYFEFSRGTLVVWVGWARQLEAENAALKEQLADRNEERRYTLKEIKEMYLPDSDLDSLRSISEEWTGRAIEAGGK